MRAGLPRIELARRLLGAADVRRIDRASDALAAAAARPEQGVEALMARAGGAVAAAAEARFGGRRGSAAVLAGPGANGGDGYVAARRLAQTGRETVVLALGAPKEGPAAAARAAWIAEGGALLEIPEAGGLDAVLAQARLGDAAYLIDALFGVGLARPLEGAAAALVAAANAASAAPDGPSALSVDVPSGVASDTGRALGPAIRADATVSFIAAKRGVALGCGALLAGAVEIAEIGAAPAALETWPDQTTTLGPFLWSGRLSADQGDAGLGKAVAAHKYEHGAALVASGGFGASGAARLAARGALRIGAGLVTVAAPAAAMAECAAQLTAVMLREAETPEAFAALLEDRRLNAALIGPGHGVHDGGAARSRAFVEALLASAAYRAGARAAVLDADALTCWPEPERLFERLQGGATVLTPHGGEFARLFPDLAARLEDPAEAARFGKFEACRAAAARSGAVVLLKGFDTVIAAPDGRAAAQTAVGARAAPWLATAGAGDVLAGLILGLAARGLPPFEAAAAGAWAHLEAALRVGPGLIAEDLTEAVPAVLNANE